MPQGKGTYGNQVGRPSKNKTMANGDPKKKKAVGKFQSREEAKANIKSFGKGEGRGTGLKTSPEQERATRKKWEKKAYKKDAPTKQKPAPDHYRGPRSEGKRGRGTGWAN